MNISDVAQRTGLSAHTIRFYEKTGVLPAIRRSDSGVRRFTESDVTFLEFVSALRRTGMSLEDIAEFTQDGCILERLKSNDIPAAFVNRRMSILQHHREKLMEQRRELDMFLDAVRRKLDFYERYLVGLDHATGETSE